MVQWAARRDGVTLAAAALVLCVAAHAFSFTNVHPPVEPLVILAGMLAGIRGVVAIQEAKLPPHFPLLRLCPQPLLWAWPVLSAYAAWSAYASGSEVDSLRTTTAMLLPVNMLFLAIAVAMGRAGAHEEAAV